MRQTKNHDNNYRNVSEYVDRKCLQIIADEIM